MSTDEPERDVDRESRASRDPERERDRESRVRRETREGERGLMGNVWHGVSALYAAVLMFAQVYLRLDVPWPLWIVVALIAEPGAFSRIAMSHGADLLKWIKRP